MHDCAFILKLEWRNYIAHKITLTFLIAKQV
jgi:hypothetical protein